MTGQGRGGASPQSWLQSLPKTLHVAGRLALCTLVIGVIVAWWGGLGWASCGGRGEEAVTVGAAPMAGEGVLWTPGADVALTGDVETRNGRRAAPPRRMGRGPSASGSAPSS